MKNLEENAVFIPPNVLRCLYTMWNKLTVAYTRVAMLQCVDISKKQHKLSIGNPP